MSTTEPERKAPANNRELAQELRDTVRYVDIRELVLRLDEASVLTPIVQQTILMVADALDIHEAGGMELSDWTTALNLVELMCGGPPFARQEKQPELLVVNNVSVESVRKLRTG